MGVSRKAVVSSRHAGETCPPGDGDDGVGTSGGSVEIDAGPIDASGDSVTGTGGCVITTGNAVGFGAGVGEEIGVKLVKDGGLVGVCRGKEVGRVWIEGGLVGFLIGGEL